MSERTITEITRRNIADAFALNNVNWAGRFEEHQFLARLFDLQTMPSNDYRFSNAADDIWQHRVRNLDWENDWVFYDSRFNLLSVPDEVFLRFLCETLHPAVQAQPEAVDRIRLLINQNLAKDGWELSQQQIVSGRPVFVAAQLGELLRKKDVPDQVAQESNSYGMKVQKQIFVSYAQPNAVEARALAKFLQSAGFTTWLDKENLVAGEEW